MKKLLTVLGLTLTMGLVGCGQTEVKEPTVKTDYEVVDIDSTEVSEEDTSVNEETTNIILPNDRMTMESLSENEDLSVEVEFINEDDNTIGFRVYGYETYNKDLVENMKVGDSIHLHDELISIEKLDIHKDTGVIRINDGLEVGGYTLVKDENTNEYYETIENGLKIYYMIGHSVIWEISDDFTFVNKETGDTGNINMLKEAIGKLAVENTVLQLRNNKVMNIIVNFIP